MLFYFITCCLLVVQVLGIVYPCCNSWKAPHACCTLQVAYHSIWSYPMGWIIEQSIICQWPTAHRTVAVITAGNIISLVIPTSKREWKKGDRTRLARLCRVNHLCMLKSIRNSLCIYITFFKAYIYVLYPCERGPMGRQSPCIRPRLGELKGQYSRCDQ